MMFNFSNFVQEDRNFYRVISMSRLIASYGSYGSYLTG